jgi:hypothetical protein
MEARRFEMEYENGLDQDAFQLMVQVDGFELKVIAEKIRDQEWRLAIQNELGVNSIWLETFPDVKQAINAGITAIEGAGVQAFSSVEGFEYLLN